MVYPIENRMVVDSQWPNSESDEKLPVCKCCEEKIQQYSALHILCDRERIWICDRYIENMQEVTGY